jgi:hypothetical protein
MIKDDFCMHFGEFSSTGLHVAGHPYWSGQILRMTIWPDDKEDEERGEPNYFTASGVLSYLIDMGQTTSARSICPHILVPQPQGPDCYDLSFIVGRAPLQLVCNQHCLSLKDSQT